MILLYNETADLMEVVKISNSNLKYQNTFGKNKNLIGAHESDMGEDSRSDSQAGFFQSLKSPPNAEISKGHYCQYFL